MMQVIFYILAGTFVGMVLFWLWQRSQKIRTDERQNEALERLDRRMNEMSQLLLSQLNERLRENRDSVHTVHQEFQSFTREVTALTETVKQVQSSVEEVSSFQDILRAPKLRGRWGELSLEHLLAQYFPRDAYELQYQFSSGELVDALLKLPNGRYLTIDAKFPLEDFTRMIEAESEIQREAFEKSFASQVRKEIDDIAKKYILPGEGTTEFALMYVPAEAVFYEIVNRMSDEDLATYARNKKVILTSPNTFFLMIQVIQHWARDLQVGRQTQEIMKRLGRIATDAEKLSSGFDRLGKYLDGAMGAYEDIQKRIGLLVNRVERVVEVGGGEEPRAFVEEADNLEEEEAGTLLEDAEDEESSQRQLL